MAKVLTKAEMVKQTIKDTRERRKQQKLVVFQLKLQNLSNAKIQKLNRAFLEAKWLYNYCVANSDLLFDANFKPNKIKSVQIQVKDKLEDRRLDFLGSQVKQEIVDRIKDNIKALSTLKNNGHKVGRLKFKKYVNSIPLKQHGITFKLSKNNIVIQKLGKFRVLGVHQIPDKIANAILVKKPTGFYVHIACYLPKDYGKKEKIGNVIAVDFGIKDKATLSNGVKIDFEISETDRLKKLQKKLSRQKQNSRNSLKTVQKIRKEHEYLTNVRKDIQNKIYSFFKHYDKVIFQDDNIKGWHKSLFGKQVQHSGIGAIKSRLKNSLETPIPISQYALTTNECFNCGKRLNLSLADRYFHCDCGWQCDRDLNASYVMLRKGLGLSHNQTLPTDCGKVTPAEMEASARILGSNPYISVSYTSAKQEAPQFIEERMSPIELTINVHRLYLHIQRFHQKAQRL